MALPQFSRYRPNGVALNVFGLTNAEQFDEMSLLLFGLAFPADAIWTLCPVVTGTTWTLCSTYAATWTPVSGVTTTWVNS